MVFAGILFVNPFPSQVLLLLLIFTFFFVLLSIIAKNIVLRYCFIIIFSLGLSLSILEGYFYVALYDNKKIRTLNTSQNQEQNTLPNKSPEKKFSKSPLTQNSNAESAEFNPELKHSTVHAIRKIDTQNLSIFDVKYTRNSKKKRITPYMPNAQQAVILLGCSFTFGDGISDTETSAWQLAKILGENYQVYNLGSSGSAPHQILHNLEKDLPNLEKFSKLHFYYIAIDDHVRRVGGAASWDKDGPLYEIQNGKAVHIGKFKDVLPFFKTSKVDQWLGRSYLYDKIQILAENILAPYDTEQRQELFGALVQGINDFIHNNYQRSSFTVLLWPPNTAELTSLINNISSINLENYFPNFEQEREKYVVFYPHEMHPSAYANGIVAQKLAKHVRNETTILRQETP